MVADKKSFFPAGEKKCEVESKDGYHSNARCERTEGRRGGCGGVTSCKVPRLILPETPMPALIVTRAVIMGWIGICLFVVYLIGLQYCQYCRVQNNLSDLSVDLSNYKYLCVHCTWIIFSVSNLDLPGFPDRVGNCSASSWTGGRL